MFVDDGDETIFFHDPFYENLSYDGKYVQIGGVFEDLFLDNGFSLYVAAHLL